MRSLVNRMVWEEEVDSTNRCAERLLIAGSVEDGTVIATRFQTEGKGQGRHHWLSEKGMNILMSMILRPSWLSAGNQFLLNKAVTLGAIDFLSSIGVGAMIKWPNDLYAGINKTGGILITHRVSGTVLESTIAGIGINLNQTVFSPELPNPTSVKLLTGKEHPLEDAVNDLVDKLNRRYGELKSGRISRLQKDYQSALKGIGQWKEYVGPDGPFEGMITGVDAFGRLMVETRNHRIDTFQHGEIII